MAIIGGEGESVPENHNIRDYGRTKFPLDEGEEPDYLLKEYGSSSPSGTVLPTGTKKMWNRKRTVKAGPLRMGSQNRRSQ
ncbi:hypothetical protein AVEN_38824-1 [Araneus ventricosus]|uniref:Uncharacterized protein n=1 Tax=Araneus ventricosus TaxID=182803 RepID=A0A4Y2JZX3_ARAVE|nr:hypothetical protein AVEN_38824-1 [Araneus ventricosus]